MKIQIIQSPPADFEEHLDIELDSRADLIILPEFWKVRGFTPEEVAPSIKTSNTFLKPFWEWIEKHYYTGVLCTGSSPILERGKVYNRAYLLQQDKEGDRQQFPYDKACLFEPMGEPGSISPGGIAHELWNWKVPYHKCSSSKIGMAICYDLRFPTLFAPMKEQNVDIIIVPMCWPLEREHIYDTLLRARAIENEALVIGVNKLGRSVVYDKDGALVYKMTPENATSKVVEYGKTLIKSQAG